ncbi:MAG: ABC transporter permease [Planctomycetes bacterium]|nr:ABC transporter permease [Planctomycetota bacterium]MCB9910131.1 ABC transporter permease [Planctomycetota bacterium]MCB9913102.1 ABC transporter permease [Planctomycetota bacterium]
MPPATAPPHPHPIQPKAGPRGILLVAATELRSSLRDRQTVMNSVVLPIVMYPVLFWFILQGILVVQGHKERTRVEVALVGAPEQVADLQSRLLGLSLPLDPDTQTTTPNPVDFRSLPDGPQDDAALRAWLISKQHPEAESIPDAILRLPEGPNDKTQLYLESTRSGSELAAERMRKRIAQVAEQLRQDAAKSRGLTPQDLDPLDIAEHTITTSRDQGAFVLSLFLPMMIIIMAVMGAFFPAVDSTAGEKERGTAETTLLLPIPRSQVLLGKIVATSALAFLATVLNLTFMGLAARHLLGTLGPKIPFRIEFPFLALLYSLPLVLLFCFFVSAVLTALAGLTKSFKEGQAMLGPAQMVFILPAIIGIMPGLKLGLGWSLVPVVNVVLAVRSILVMDWLPIPYLLTGLVLLVSAWLAVRLCVRLLSQEALAFSGSSISFKHLLRMLRHAKS